MKASFFVNLSTINIIKSLRQHTMLLQSYNSFVLKQLCFAGYVITKTLGIIAMITIGYRIGYVLF